MNRIPLLTVFTPAYNRADTLQRTYESLCRQTSKNFTWLIIDDGSTDNTAEVVSSWRSKDNGFPIEYVYKENGGLHTGYNKAIELMKTELCVCIDSDDFMPDDAVELIQDFWKEHKSADIAGFIGLDFFMNGTPIGGEFPPCDEPIHLHEIQSKLGHFGDTKMVLRTDLLKKVYPQPSFPGEKNFNPIYLMLLVDRTHPFLILNKNLCFVDYQEGGMTANIFRQYVNSPNSFAALRMVAILQPGLPYKRYLMEHLHYVAEKVLAGKYASMFSEGASIMWVLLFWVPGWLLSKYIKFKAKH